jgi:hypothetical protein
MPDFFGEIDEVKNAVRQNIRSDVSATINKAHYKDGVSYELATALACEAVIDCFARVGVRKSGATAQMLRWMLDEIEKQSLDQQDMQEST